MKKILSIIILLACIVSSTFALSAKIESSSVTSSYRTITVYDDNNVAVLIYRRPYVSTFYKNPVRTLYAISWYKEGATVEQIKEWKDFAKLFVEEEY